MHTVTLHFALFECAMAKMTHRLTGGETHRTTSGHRSAGFEERHIHNMMREQDINRHRKEAERETEREREAERERETEREREGDSSQRQREREGGNSSKELMSRGRESERVRESRRERERGNSEQKIPHRDKDTSSRL